MQLIAACGLFVGAHWLISGSPLRGVIVARTGERAFKAGFALIITVSVVWMVVAFARAPYVETWGTATALKPVALVLMAFAFVLFATGIVTRNPTTLGQYAPDEVQVRGVLRITRNPGLIGLGLWGLAHFIVNGDVAAHLLYGSFAVQGLIAPFNMERKYHRRYGARWEAYARQSSHVPFLAILTGRNRLALREIPWPAALAGLAAFAVTLVFHQSWFGASPLS